MGIVSSIVVFILVWWCVIFCVLPLGLPREMEEQGREAFPGSPKVLNMKQKLLLTTVISFVIWLVICTLIWFDILDLAHILQDKP